ncbi:acetyl-CoA carboxylase, biotin carboxyl carrier protein [Longispora fulva]|uniref:Biotin carboxyl carrier protein of acetyl-CoA carboxylase n=1 Tax=Longispora fulva TaxID=619741 RepID=A0A8J7GEM0_9ACTN|nr:biotin/lipoyl-containing protein [Longispora fulva]MBG6134363.1 acetyl-CoA carboxylase biotin carboxyl carrier protein [Longispora fulva]GIG63072.1 acetyl-CoA carboxylase, biotin carboxyl carrier protein [Longispora fulva]
MTEIIESYVAVGPLAEALDDVRRSAQQLLAEVTTPPKALRIRAGDVCLELEWTGPTDVYGVQDSSDAAPRPARRTADPACDSPPAGGGHVHFCSPTVGTFYRSPQPGAVPFVAEGDQVRRGQQIGIVEAMKLMIPLEAEFDGQLARVLVEDNTPVEFGARLFAFVPEPAG